MGRVVFELAGFFFLPFLAYALFLVWHYRNPREVKRVFSQKAFVIQSLIGLALMLIALLAVGFLDQPHKGGYSPAVFKDGQLVPGRVQ